MRLLLFSFSIVALLGGFSAITAVPAVTAAETPVAADDAAPAAAGAERVVELTPKNTKIAFVGNHKGDDPKPRKGGFGEFAGKVTVAGDAVRSIDVTIQTASLTTEISKLTNHLKSSDFFDVRQYPEARFISTSVKPGEGGKIMITGNLTLLGKTKPISFPATVKTDTGLGLKSQFTIDRTAFGMTYGTDGVEEEIPLTITVSAK